MIKNYSLKKSRAYSNEPLYLWLLTESYAPVANMDEPDFALASEVVRFIFIGTKDFNEDVSWRFPHFLNLYSSRFESGFLFEYQRFVDAILLFKERSKRLILLL